MLSNSTPLLKVIRQRKPNIFFNNSRHCIQKKMRDLQPAMLLLCFCIGPIRGIPNTDRESEICHQMWCRHRNIWWKLLSHNRGKCIIKINNSNKIINRNKLWRNYEICTTWMFVKLSSTTVKRYLIIVCVTMFFRFVTLQNHSHTNYNLVNAPFYYKIFMLMKQYRPHCTYFSRIVRLTVVSV